MNIEVDFLVIGSGIAGLSFALKAAEKGKVLIVTKNKIEESNTRYAQGGIASVTANYDHFEKHIADTLIAGDGICNKRIVELVIKEAPACIEELTKWGVKFDKTADGAYELGREGGHSENRILHHKDNTGFEIQRALTEQVKKHANITILEYHFAIELITQHHLGKLVKRIHKDIECYGAYVLNLKNKEVNRVLSKVCIIATGGSGNVYETTTNPNIATGDGIAMVYRAKGIVENMEFFQFHPTSLYNPGERPSYLITEAMRGDGGILRGWDGDEFMHHYDPRGSLAPRDIVARAIDNEMKKRGDDFVYLDCRHLDKEKLLHHFPNINEKCLSLNIDISKDMIPVIPAAHYQCGGIRVDENGETSIHQLYAAGEVSSTGLHGANRLASNSLLEALVFANRAVMDATEKIQHIGWCKEVPIWNYEGTSFPLEMIMVTQNSREVRQLMSNYVGIVRSDKRLDRALSRLEIIYLETEDFYKKSVLSKRLCELRNLINVAYLIIKNASDRKESRGLHFNMDHPSRAERMRPA